MEQTMYRLEHSPQITGHFTHGGEDYRIEDGIIEVETESVARELLEYRRIEWHETDATPGVDADESGDEDICGAEMTDGSICERPASECPYH